MGRAGEAILLQWPYVWKSLHGNEASWCQLFDIHMVHMMTLLVNLQYIHVSAVAWFVL